MELLVAAVGVMALGAILVHLAMQGAKAEQVPVAALVPEPPLPDRTPEATEAEPLPPSHAIEFSKSDVLLADTLTELLTVRQQMSSLQARVDALNAELHSATSSARSIRRRPARGAA
jgi:hypothetical protein